MSALSNNNSETNETDILLRQLFVDADEPRIATNLAERAVRLARDPLHDPANASARFIRRCVMTMNVLGIVLISLIIWKVLPTVWAAFDTTDSTTVTTSTTTSSELVSTIEIASAALLLFVAAGTQWAFRAPVNAPGLLPICQA